MSESKYLKVKFISWIEEMSVSDIDKLISDSQCCDELDRCFRYCVDTDCQYYALLLLVRTPTENFRRRVVEWINSITEEELNNLLEKGLICGKQSFCLQYCGAVNCGFKGLIRGLCAISEFKA